MHVGDRFIGYSIIGSRFDCAIVDSQPINDVVAIIPTIRGRGWITGTHQLMYDPDDPWPVGYRLTDTWPKRAN
jgi:proline racemase